MHRCRPLRIRLLLLIACLLGTAAAGRLRAAPPTEPMGLWPGQPAEGGGESARLTAYLPEAGTATGAAFVVCPGGGYGGLAPHEAEPIARWFTSLGITGFVLEYRHAPHHRHPAPLQDAGRAIRTIRARAAEWGLDPARIGILGFSAGGHLAASAGTHFDAGAAAAADPIDRASSRPDLMVLVYPVISFTTPFTHVGSRTNLLGPDADPELIKLMSNELQVTPQTPPAFLIHTVEDTVVPYENSLLFVQALRAAGVPHEFHLYERGPHGFGLGASQPGTGTWPAVCAGWLEIHGFARRQAP